MAAPLIGPNFFHDMRQQINASRLNDEYSDVTFFVGDTSFKCHRLIVGSACDYFNELFKKNSKKLRTEKIHLKEIEASTFKEVLEFIYLGKDVITASNLFDMIRASVSYELTGIERLCIAYIRRCRRELIENAFEIFAYVKTKEKSSLLNALYYHIRIHLNYFSTLDAFLDITFDDLNSILMEPIIFKSQNVLLNAILRWIQQPRHLFKIDQYFEELLKRVHFKNISPEYMQFLVKRHLKRSIISDIIGSSYSEIPSSPVSSAGTEVDEGKYPMSLHVFHNFQEDCSGTYTASTTIFTMQKDINDHQWVLSNCVRPDVSFPIMKTVQLDHQLYYLGIHTDPNVQTFGVSCSVSLLPDSILKSPPYFVRQFDLCGRGDSVFMYDKDVVVQNLQDLSSDDNALSQCVFAYNCGMDKWTALPHLKMELSDACMTCDNDTAAGLLYLIGGHNDQEFGTFGGFAQTYDHRVKKWTAITRSSGVYEKAACCFYKGKIYVCGGIKNPRKVEMYDPVAGRWMVLTDMNSDKSSPRLIVYENQLWAFNSNPYGAEFCQGHCQRWYTDQKLSCTLESLKTTLLNRNNFRRFLGHNIADVIVFKSVGL